MGSNSKCFIFCGSCSKKVKKDNLREGEYYCPFADTKNGIVYSTTDATECDSFIQIQIR